MQELDISAISNWLSGQDNIIGSIHRYKLLSGGYSNITYSIYNTQGQEFILRRPPNGLLAKGGHDMIRESNILRGLAVSGFNKSPRVVVSEAKGNIIGVPFYIMEKIEGTILRPGIKNISPENYKITSKLLIKNLADLHKIDLNSSDLINIGKPEGYVERQVNGWVERNEKSKTDDIPEMTFLAEWLIKNIPASHYVSLIHNDYKYDNVVFSQDLQDLIGILDWEMTTIGDPLMDLGVTLAWWFETGDSDFTKSINITFEEGCMNRAEVIQYYQKLTGYDLGNILFYFIFGLFKNAVIAQQIYYRYKTGSTNDPRFANMIYGVKELSKMGVSSIKTGII